MRGFVPALIALVLSAVALPGLAETAAKIRVEGDRLIYDTVNAPEGESTDIESEDVDVLVGLIQKHPELKVVELNSDGGSVWSAARIADAVIDAELDTHVNGECKSSCTRIFLGGAKRTMSRGSRIGFHQVWWSAPAMQSYYERNAEAEGWDTPFEFAAWMYRDTQTEIHENLIYMVRRKVDPVFAIETLKYSPDEFWYPRRPYMLAAGVLTE